MSSESIPRVVVALAMGLCSGLLLLFVTYVVIGDRPMGAAAANGLAAGALLGGWALSTAWMLRRARSVGTVVQRGLLLSTLLWTAVTVLGVGFGVELAGDALATHDQRMVEAGIQAGGLAIAVVLVGAGGMALLSLGALLAARYVAARRRAERAAAAGAAVA